MKLREFLSKQRIIILIVSWLLAILLFILALKLEQYIGWSSLLTNLAAASFATGVTITSIDYLLSRENYLSVAEGIDLGRDEIKTLISQIDSNVARMFGFDFTKIKIPKRQQGQTAPDINILFNTFDAALRVHLDQMMDEHDTKAPVAQRKSYEDRLKEIVGETDILLSRYGYALPNKEKTAVLKLRKQLNSIVQLMELKLPGNEKSTEAAIKRMVVELHKQMLKDFPTYYEPRKSKTIK